MLSRSVLKLLAILLLSVFASAQTVTSGKVVFGGKSVSGGGVSGGGGGTFTHTQVVSSRSAFATNYTCAALVCTFNLDGGVNHGAATGSGHALVIYTFDDNADGKIISSVSGGCSVAWVVQSSAAINVVGLGTFNAATCTSSSAAATSIAVTFNSGTLPSSAAGILHEFAYSGASVSFDTAATISNTSPSTSPPGPALTPTGTQDVIIQMLGIGSGNPTAISAPYNTNFTTAGSDGNTMAFIGTSYVMNSASGTAPTWTITSAISFASALAMKGN